MLQRSVDTFRYLATDPLRSVRAGQTPHAIIHRDGPANLRYFAPTVPATASGSTPAATLAPVFVSMPLINTWTIFDLVPGHSVIAALTAAGVPVYVLDWGRPGPEASATTLSRLIDGTLRRAVDRACRHASVAMMDAIGYCVGGTFLAAHLARHPGRIRRVAFLATPIDFHASGRLALWAKPDTFPVDDIVDGLGNFPASLMKTSFQWLRPTGQTGKWVGLWERIDEPGFPELWAALEKWNGDAVDFPGEAYREYIRRCYFDNALMAGGWMMAGEPVDLSRATIPALVLAASADHIVPAPSAFGLSSVWGGPVECRTVRGGHVGVCIGKALPSTLVEWARA